MMRDIIIYRVVDYSRGGGTSYYEAEKSLEIDGGCMRAPMIDLLSDCNKMIQEEESMEWIRSYADDKIAYFEVGILANDDTLKRTVCVGMNNV